MKIITKILALVFLLGTINTIDARVDPEKLKKMKDVVQFAGARMNCQQSEAQIDLDINNVKARLLAGGDLWWDLQNGKYIVPKPAPGFPEVSAIICRRCMDRWG